MAGAGVPVSLILVVMTGLVISQDFTYEQIVSLNTTVHHVMQCANIPSLSLAIVSLDKKVAYTSGFIRPFPNGPTNVRARSVFCIGGATQAFTAVLLAKLLDKNENVTWDTPIQDIVNYKIALPGHYLSRKLNLKDIFSMRSGLAGMDIVPVTNPFTVEKLIENLQYAPPVAGFREKFIYNEVLFSLLEEVFKVLGNDTWHNLIRENIFQPLEMTSTTFAGLKFPNLDLIEGTVLSNANHYILPVDSYSGLELVAPAASVCTTAEDMSKWFEFLLNDGKLRGNRVIVDKEALKATYAAVQTRGQDGDPVIQGYHQTILDMTYSRDHNSLGWINGYYRGYAFVSQDGSIPGYQTLATIIPSKKAAVFIAFTGDQDDKRFAAKTLTSAPYPLEHYVGTYKNYAYGDVHVQYNTTGDKAFLTLQYGTVLYKLDPTNKNSTFQLRTEGNLWYSTGADWHRTIQPIYAEFIPDLQDADQRINSVRIYGFDRHYVPEFSTNAEPPRYDEYTDNYRCSASVLAVWQWSILLVIARVHFS